MSASAVTSGSWGPISTRPNPPCPISAPASRNSSAVDSTVRAATPERDTLMSKTTPNASTSAMDNPSSSRFLRPHRTKGRPDFPALQCVKMPQKSARGKPNVYRAAGADMRARQDFRKDPHLPATGNRLELVPMPGTACADTDLPGNQLAVKTVHPA
jgi:hypothetical protein